jgi:hypothetical protein
MIRKKIKKYDSSFSAAGLLHHEFIALKDIILGESFEDEMKLEEAENKYLGVPTHAARIRMILEIRRRYHAAPDNFWYSFFDWSVLEQKVGLFFLCLKAYPLLLDLHLDVAIKKYKIGSTLEAYDITMYFDELASKNDEVASWSAKTIDKLNSRYRKMLLDLEIYDGKNLKRANINRNTFWSYFEEINESWFLEACFLKS